MKNNVPEDDDESREQNNKLFKVGEFEISRKVFWIIILIYSSIVLVLKYKFDSKIAEFLYQIGFLVLIIGIIFIIYRMLKITVVYIKNKYFKWKNISLPWC